MQGKSKETIRTLAREFFRAVPGRQPFMTTDGIRREGRDGLFFLTDGALAEWEASL
jgi:hypothetical protein